MKEVTQKVMRSWRRERTISIFWRLLNLSSQFPTNIDHTDQRMILDVGWLLRAQTEQNEGVKRPQQTWQCRFFWFSTREPKLPLFRILLKRFHDALETRHLLQNCDIVPARVDQPTGTRVFHLLFFIKSLQTVQTSHHCSLHKPADIPISVQRDHHRGSLSHTHQHHYACRHSANGRLMKELIMVHTSTQQTSTLTDKQMSACSKIN